MISAVILTYNEENILQQCLRALDFVDEIIVFDSFSTDRTVEIAKEYGARVVQNTFDNYAKQRNLALKEVSVSSEWVLMVDADEIVSQELKEEIIHVTKLENNAVTLYYVRRKDFLDNKWIKNSSGYPTWFGRLFRAGEVWIEREINEEYHTNGKIGYLKENLKHYPFNKGIHWWFEKHNRYSTMEAYALSYELEQKIRLKNLFSNNPTIRRRTLKNLIYRLPFRPIIIFWGLFIVRFGFLDGKAGYKFCKLRKTYEWMIDLKMDELKKTSNHHI